LQALDSWLAAIRQTNLTGSTNQYLLFSLQPSVRCTETASAFNVMGSGLRQQLTAHLSIPNEIVRFFFAAAPLAAFFAIFLPPGGLFGLAARTGSKPETPSPPAFFYNDNL